MGRSLGLKCAGGRKTAVGMDTPLKINMEHNHGGLEDDLPYKWIICRFHVNLPGCT